MVECAECAACSPGAAPHCSQRSNARGTTPFREDCSNQHPLGVCADAHSSVVPQTSSPRHVWHRDSTSACASCFAPPCVSARCVHVCRPSQPAMPSRITLFFSAPRAIPPRLPLCPLSFPHTPSVPAYRPFHSIPFPQALPPATRRTPPFPTPPSPTLARCSHKTNARIEDDVPLSPPLRLRRARCSRTARLRPARAAAPPLSPPACSAAPRPSSTPLHCPYAPPLRPSRRSSNIHDMNVTRCRCLLGDGRARTVQCCRACQEQEHARAGARRRFPPCVALSLWRGGAAAC